MDALDSIHPINILLVEDNEADAKISRRAFEKARISCLFRLI